MSVNLQAVTHPARSVSCNLPEAIRARNSAKLKGILPGLPEPYRLHPVLFSNAELWTKDQVQRTVRSIRNDLRHPRWAVADFPAMAHYVDPDLCSLAGGSRYFRCSFPAPGAAPDILRSALLCLEFARDFPEEDPSAVQLF